MWYTRVLDGFVLAAFALAACASASPTPPPWAYLHTTTLSAAPAASTVSIIVGSSATQTTSTASTTSAASNMSAASATSTASGPSASSTAARSKYCAWCSEFPIPDSDNYCNLIVQVPEKLSASLDHYPAFVFNRDFTVLLRAEMISSIASTTSWSFPSHNEPEKRINVVFLPNMASNKSTEAPKIAFNAAQYNHDKPWTIRWKAGEMAPGVQSTVFHTSFLCSAPP